MVDNNSSESIRPCDVKNLINLLKLGKACRIIGISNEYFKHLT